ncbi:MAG: TlyA family RNA methyltransferase [Pseudomonadota bacterium]
MRLDAWLVETGAVRSRERAKEAIKAGNVRINGTLASKASTTISPTDEVTCEGETHAYVSRAALKLLKGLEYFKVDPAGKICLDLGASTGGFTQVLLEQGAIKIYAVDVGHGQLDEALCQSPQVINMERTHAKVLSRQLIADPIELLVCDVSFISLTKALPSAMSLCARGAKIVALVKPQFEVGPGHIGKGGLVSMPRQDQIEFIQRTIYPMLTGADWVVSGLTESPIKGGDGNTEYLLGAQYAP